MNQDSFVPSHPGGSEILRRFGKSSGQLLAVIRDRSKDLALAVVPLIHPRRSHQPAVGPAETRASLRKPGTPGRIRPSPRNSRSFR